MKKQNIQADQYHFPYHYIPQTEQSVFLSRHWNFAASYIAALQLISNWLNSIIQNQNKSKHRHLDIGCGDGALIHHLSRMINVKNIRFTGVDVDERSIAWAKMFNKSATLSVMDIKNISDTFDSATLVEVIEHIPPEDLHTFLDNVAKLVRPGGAILITVPSVEKPVAPKHFQHFTMGQLKDILEKNFSNIEIHGFEKSGYLLRTLRKSLMNKYMQVDSPFLNRIIIDQLRKIHTKQKGCGRLIATCIRPA